MADDKNSHEIKDELRKAKGLGVYKSLRIKDDCMKKRVYDLGIEREDHFQIDFQVEPSGVESRDIV